MGFDNTEEKELLAGTNSNGLACFEERNNVRRAQGKKGFTCTQSRKIHNAIVAWAKKHTDMHVVVGGSDGRISFRVRALGRIGLHDQNPGKLSLDLVKAVDSFVTTLLQQHPQGKREGAKELFLKNSKELHTQLGYWWYRTIIILS